MEGRLMNQQGQDQPITRQEIDKLLHFRPLFDVPDRPFVESTGGGQDTGDGAITVRYPIYPQDVLEFYRLAGQPCWSDYHYRPREAARMLADEAFIRRATLAEVKTMLTYCVRGERFGDGHWAAMLESGKIVALLERLRVLRDQIEPDGASHPASA
jgi:hypothetical protein